MLGSSVLPPPSVMSDVIDVASVLVTTPEFPSPLDDNDPTSVHPSTTAFDPKFEIDVPP